MTQEDLSNPEEARETPDPDPLAALLQRALAQPPQPRIHFLPHIQERIRQRTRGRYFARQRSAFRDPIILLLIAATLIVLMGTVVFLVLEPLMSQSGGTPTPTEGK